LVNGIFLM